jgi:polyribonucleotide nucleotidyltransferase
MREALAQARDARLFILGEMKQVIDKPRADLSKYAPRIDTVKINPDKIRDIIGPGGKMIRAIQSESGTNIEVEDDGTIRITGAKPEGRDKARAMIEGLTKEPEVGEVFEGKVTRIMSIGAFVEYLPGKEGLVRVSEISNERVNSIEDAVKVGEHVKVKVAEVDRQGRVNLSIRAVNEDPAEFERRSREQRARFTERGPGDGDRGGFRPGGGGGFRRSGPPR